MGQSASVSPSGSRRGSRNGNSSRRCSRQIVSPLSPAAIEHAKLVVACPVPCRLPELLTLNPVDLEEQKKHTWNPQDKSPNLYVIDEDPLTIHRHPIAQSTDICRGKQAYSRGLHVWKVQWPTRQRGTHAVVGVCTNQAPLHCAGYKSLLGADEHGYGWDLGRNRTYHGSSRARVYPQMHRPQIEKAGATNNNRMDEDDDDVYSVPEQFFMVLDMEKGTLGFIAGGRWLGPAFSGLKGKQVFPAVSSVWGHAEITLTYINGLKPEPMTLKELCRQQIRQTLEEEELYDQVHQLPLPNIIKSYVLYRTPLSVLLPGEQQPITHS